MEYRQNDTDRVKHTSQRKTCPSATLSITNLHLDWSGFEPSSPCDKPVTNCLSLSMTTFGGPLFISSPYHQLHGLEPFVILPSPSRYMPVYDLDWATTSFNIFISSSFNTGNPSIMTALLNNSSIKCSYFILTLKAGCWVFTKLADYQVQPWSSHPFLGSLLELVCMHTVSFQTSALSV